MSSSGAWLRQANSDMHAANCLVECNSEVLYCQISAKCQQVVEKSVKAIAAEFTERGIVTLTIGFKHDISKLIIAIITTPHARKNVNSVLEYISSTLKQNRLNIQALMGLAPHKPTDGDGLPRNTEYPFHNERSVLIAPSDSDVFTKTETEGHLKVAGAVLKQARKLIFVSKRTPN